MGLELKLFIIVIVALATIAFHVYGIVLSLRKLRATIEVEKLAKSYGLDYSIRNKFWMYVVCILFSWLAYSAFCRLENEGSEQNGKNND